MKPLILLLASVAVASGNESTPSKGITLASGQVITDATVLSQDAAFVTFAHNEGIARVSKADLPQEVLDFYSLDFDRQAARTQEEQELTEKREHALAYQRQRLADLVSQNMETISGKLLDITEHGALIKSAGEIIHVEGTKPFQGVADGELLELRGWRHGTYEYTTVLFKKSRVPNYILDPKKVAHLMEVGQINVEDFSRKSGPQVQTIGASPIKAN
jgi:hypothetical protein